MKLFITGVTGLLGGELLVLLSQHKDIEKIFCLIRASEEQEARARLAKVFGVHDDPFDEQKVIPIIGDLLQENLTDILLKNKELGKVDVIIHSAANTCFSRIYDKLVDATNIGGLTRILLWAKQLDHLQTFLYIGTATSCGMEAKNRVVFEDESPNLDTRHLVRYTYSKMQGEILVHQHLQAGKILIVRPSIITGDSRLVKPRSPIILWAIATINQLRLVPLNEHALLDMVPVDFVAEAIARLLAVKRNHSVYHISSGHDAATSASRLSKLLEKEFESKPQYQFLNKTFISQIKLWSKRGLKEGSELYNYLPYLDYWETVFEDRKQLRILLAGLEPYIEFIDLGQQFDNSRLLHDTGLTSPMPAHEYLKHSTSFIKEINLIAGAVDA